MVRFLPCSLPSNSKDPDQLISTLHSYPSSSSSIASQSSLQSLPSLSLPSSDQTGGTSAARHHCSATLQGHSSYVFSIAIAGKNLYTGASGGDLRAWDRNPNSSNSIHNTVVADDLSAVKSIAVLGDKIFTGHNDRKIRVWKIGSTAEEQQRQKPVAVLPTMSDRWSRIFSPGNYVRVRRQKKCTWVHHVDAVSALAVDTSALYSASWDRSLKVWRTSDFKCLQSIQNAHDDAINAVVVSAADGTVYTGSADKKIKVWRKLAAGNKLSLIATLERHKSAVNALALSADGSILYSGACDRSIVVWEKDGGASHMSVAGALRGHTKAILCLSAVGDLVCSGSADRTVRIWRREMGKYACLGVLEGHGSPVKCLVAGIDTRYARVKSSDEESGEAYLVYSGSLDKEIKVWKVWVPDSRDLGGLLR